MKPSKLRRSLEVLIFSSYLSCFPQSSKVPVQAPPLSPSEEQLVQKYEASREKTIPDLDQKCSEDPICSCNEDPSCNFSRGSFFGQEIKALWKKTPNEKGSFYNLVVHSDTPRDLDLLFYLNKQLLFNRTGDYLNQIKEKYAVEVEDVNFFDEYVSTNTFEIGKVKIKLQYKVGEAQGFLGLYDEAEQKKITSTLIPSQLALATLHFTYMEVLKRPSEESFLIDDYIITEQQGKYKFELLGCDYPNH